MATKTISVRPSDRAAQVCEEASPETKRKFDALVSMRFTEATRSTRSLEEIMIEISRKAQRIAE